MLQLGNFIFQFPGINPLLGNFRVVDQVVIFLGNVNVSKGFAVDPFDVVRAKEGHLCAGFNQFIELVRDGNP